MAVTMIEVFGEVVLPDGTPPVSARLEFQLSGWARDAVHLFIPALVSVEVTPDGSFQVNLQTTTGKCVHYAVVLRYRRDGLPDHVLNMGMIEVAAISPQALSDLLPAPEAKDESAVVVSGGVAQSVVARAAAKVQFKRGDTIAIGAIMTTRYGQVQDLTGISVAASMMGPDNVIRDMTVTVDADPTSGRLVLSMPPVDTASLPIGQYFFDVKRTNSDGAVRRTPSVEVEIISEVTQ